MVMPICGSFIIARSWDNYAIDFAQGYYGLYIGVLSASVLPIVFDKGKISYATAGTFLFALGTVLWWQYYWAMLLVFGSTGQFGQFCHGDMITPEVMAKIHPPSNTRLFYFELLKGAAFTAALFWLPILVIRKIKRAPNQ